MSWMLAAVCQPRFLATRSAARCARRWMLRSLLMFPFSSRRLTTAWRWGMPLSDSRCSHTVDLLPARLVFGDSKQPFLSFISRRSNSATKSSHSCLQSSAEKWRVCSFAGLISIWMRLFFIRGRHKESSLTEFHIPNGSMPGGRKLSQIWKILSGCFLFADTPVM